MSTLRAGVGTVCETVELNSDGRPGTDSTPTLLSPELPRLIGFLTTVYSCPSAAGRAARGREVPRLRGVCGVVVCGDRKLVVIGEDAADEVGGFVAVAAIADVGAARLLLAVFLAAADALVEVGGVGVTAAGHGDVKQGAAGVFAHIRRIRVFPASFVHCHWIE
jgi:hypothetical protein